MEKSVDYSKKIITIPNILSFLRLCLIPVIAWLYLVVESNFLSGLFLVLSGITDVVDGFIARRFNMISDVGKVLDPVADKATQIIILGILAFKYPLMIIPIACGLAKEGFMALTGYMVIKKCGIVLGANWHGKLATFWVTATIFIHIFGWVNEAVSGLLILSSAWMILMSLFLYAHRNFGYLLGKNK